MVLALPKPGRVDPALVDVVGAMSSSPGTMHHECDLPGQAASLATRDHAHTVIVVHTGEHDAFPPEVVLVELLPS